MKKPTQHSSVSEMVQHLSDDRAFATEFNQRLSERQLVKMLAVLRARAGLSQQELAGKLDCTQSKVSKLESSADADVRLGDLLAYTEAVDHEMRIFLVPKNQRIVDEVQMYALVIKRLLHELIRQAGKDAAMVRGAEEVLMEALFNLGRFVQCAASELPRPAQERSSPLQVEAPAIDSDQRMEGSSKPLVPCG